MKLSIFPVKTTFKYVDRNFSKTIVLIPGWATDYRIFDNLNLKYNLILPVNFYPADFILNLHDFLIRKNIIKVSIFGWSLGGFLAADFASRYPNLVEQLILAGIRKKYPKPELEDIKIKLKKNQKAYLHRFYSQGFCQSRDKKSFSLDLFKDYCVNFNLSYLIETLDFLGNSRIAPELLGRMDKLKIIHAEFDRIAPIEEAKTIKDALPKAKFIILKNTGHIIFSDKELEKYI